MAQKAQQFTEKLRQSRKLWEEPVRAFLASVDREVSRPRKGPAVPLSVNAEMVATLAAFIQRKREPISLAKVEALLDQVLLRKELEERQRKAAALELLSAVMAYRALEQGAQEDDTIMLMALGLAV